MGEAVDHSIAPIRESSQPSGGERCRKRRSALRAMVSARCQPASTYRGFRLSARANPPSPRSPTATAPSSARASRPACAPSCRGLDRRGRARDARISITSMNRSVSATDPALAGIAERSSRTSASADDRRQHREPAVERVRHLAGDIPGQLPGLRGDRVEQLRAARRLAVNPRNRKPSIASLVASIARPKTSLARSAPPAY